MAHYDCKNCGASNGVSRGHCSDCRSQERYIGNRLSEGGLRLVSGSPTMLQDEFARYQAEVAEGK